MTTQIEPLSEAIKKEIIATHPNGIWLVLAEEDSRNSVTAEDFFCADLPQPPDPHT